MRLSRQRRMVLNLLWSEKSHLSARDIFEKLNVQGRSIGHTSVYQNLEALQSAGVIECLDRASGRLYGYRSDPHSHLTCLDSGLIEDIDVNLPDELLTQIEQRTGFRIESYTLQLSGRRTLEDRAKARYLDDNPSVVRLGLLLSGADFVVSARSSRGIVGVAANNG